jgi:hypothetical protein
VANGSKIEKPVMSVGSAQTETLNFKVPPEFKKEFKGFAVSQGVTMLELLKEGFERTKQKRGGKS